jgi:hypothetical protein
VKIIGPSAFEGYGRDYISRADHQVLELEEIINRAARETPFGQSVSLHIADYCINGRREEVLSPGYSPEVLQRVTGACRSAGWERAEFYDRTARDQKQLWLCLSPNGPTKTTEAQTNTATLAELQRQKTLPHICSTTASAHECPPCAAYYALANADGVASARRDVLVDAVLAQARRALHCLDRSRRHGVEVEDALLAAFKALDAHDETFSSGLICALEAK